MNSSSEMVKAIRMLAIIPGMTSGRITRRKVVNFVSPRSIAASSRFRSRLEKAVERMTVQKGVQIRTCPRMMLHRFRLNPAWRMTTSSDTPTMISGSTRGTIISPMIPFFPAKLCLVAARAAHSPIAVLKNAATDATIRLFRVAACSGSVSRSSRNQSSVNP